MTVKNIVFDIGNVIVPWDPNLIVQRSFGEDRASDAFIQSIFPGDNVWLPLNRGEISAEEAMQRYRDQLGFTSQETGDLWQNILSSMDVFPETISLMEQLDRKGYRLFALSDNVHEIVAYLKTEHDFWRFFEGAVISAEVAMLKPEPGIYEHLLKTYQIAANETLFLDDMPQNVTGAQSVGIHAIQFSNAAQVKGEMQQLGLELE